MREAISSFCAAFKIAASDAQQVAQRRTL